MTWVARVRQTRAVADMFTERLEAWRRYAETPWARIRYAVVAEVLRREGRRLGDRLRVLDVGGGDGLDAVPLAAAGHDVTVADPSEAWLAEADRRAAGAGARITTVRAGLDDLPRGEWDLVLCHYVLRYRPPGAGDLDGLARRVRPGGMLSVVDVNPAGRVLRELVTGGPAAAVAELHAERAAVATFGTEVRKVEADDVAREAESAGLTPVRRYGIRIANDLLVENAAKHDPAYFDELLALELELCDREPYARIGLGWQLVLER